MTGAERHGAATTCAATHPFHVGGQRFRENRASGGRAGDAGLVPTVGSHRWRSKSGCLPVCARLCKALAVRDAGATIDLDIYPDRKLLQTLSWQVSVPQHSQLTEHTSSSSKQQSWGGGWLMGIRQLPSGFG